MSFITSYIRCILVSSFFIITVSIGTYTIVYTETLRHDLYESLLHEKQCSVISINLVVDQFVIHINLAYNGKMYISREQYHSREDLDARIDQVKGKKELLCYYDSVINNYVTDVIMKQEIKNLSRLYTPFLLSILILGSIFFLLYFIFQKLNTFPESPIVRYTRIREEEDNRLTDF